MKRLRDIMEPLRLRASLKREYRNAPERACQLLLEEDGWLLTKRGWPDFIAFKDGRFIAIEVKPDGGFPKEEQATVLFWLARHGIECYVWTPAAGFTRIPAT